jgi:hypothetical protein
MQHMTVDCASNAASHSTPDASTVQQFDSLRAADAKLAQTLINQRAADLAAIKAKAATDPAFAALARLLGA